MQIGDYTKALSDFTEAIKLDPEYGARAYEDRSLAYEKLGKQSLADIDRQKAKALNAKMR